MQHPNWISDRATHIRIGLITAVSTVIVVLVGHSARVSYPGLAPAREHAAQIVIKAGQPAILSFNELHRAQ